MIEGFTFQLPTRVRFGFGVAGAAGEEARALGGTRVLLVTDPGVLAAGAAEGPLLALREAGLAVEVVSEVSPNPRDHECLAAVARARAFEANLIVAVGGGSPIDTAKTVAALLTHGGAPRDWEWPRTLERATVPLIAIPTTAGTGSEVTFFAVITDTVRRFKMSLLDARLAPRVALVDPGLTLTVPPAVTAATGMDALTHAIEAYTGRLAEPIADALAVEAMRLVARHLVAAVRNGTNREAREGMMLASLLAGVAFGNTDVAAVHCLAEAIGGRYDTPHGVANSVFLPHVFAHNAEAAPERHAIVAGALGVETAGVSALEAAQAGAGKLAELAREIGIPTLAELPGVDPSDFPALAEASERNVSNASNCRQMDAAAYEALLWRAWRA